MKEKYSIMTIYKFVCLLLLLSTISCKYKEDEYKVDWAGSMCRPSNYYIGPSEIEFFSKDPTNLNIPGAFCASSWNAVGQVRWFRDYTLPDSLFISYQGMNDKNQTCLYEGGLTLPKKQMEMLFTDGFREGNNFKKFSYVNVGLAPGGRICVWVDYVELLRFKIKEVKKISNNPILLGDSFVKKYLINHPINYSIWEHPDKRYELDFGFCSQDGNSKFHNCYFYSKEGLTIPVSKWDIDYTKWELPYGQPVTITNYNNYQQFNERRIRDKKLNLPVHGVFEWKINDAIFYSTDVVMPKDLELRFTKSYINAQTGNKANYNRIVFGVEKDGVHCNVWLDGPGKQEKIIRFKGQGERKDNDNTVNSGGYATEVTYY